MYVGEELLWRFLNAAKHINNAAVVCKVTYSLVTWFRKCFQVDEGSSEQLA
jgi:hypothetical protein